MPRERVVLGPFVVFTIEYDLRFSTPEEQFGWCRSAGKDRLDSLMGRVYRDFRAYTDFAGISVV